MNMHTSVQRDLVSDISNMLRLCSASVISLIFSLIEECLMDILRWRFRLCPVYLVKFFQRDGLVWYELPAVGIVLAGWRCYRSVVDDGGLLSWVLLCSDRA